SPPRPPPTLRPPPSPRPSSPPRPPPRSAPPPRPETAPRPSRLGRLLRSSSSPGPEDSAAGSESIFAELAVHTLTSLPAAKRCVCINGGDAPLTVAVRGGDGDTLGRTQVSLEQNDVDPTGGASGGLRIRVTNKLDEGVFYRAPYPARRHNGQIIDQQQQQHKERPQTNRRTTLQLLSGPNGAVVREWVQEAHEDCGVSGYDAVLEFDVGRELMSCPYHPYGNGINSKIQPRRQYVRVTDGVRVASEPCIAGMAPGNDDDPEDVLLSTPTTSPTPTLPITGDMELYLECCQCASQGPCRALHVV
ncbi:hypothetical protein Vretifemale_1777, partial [Volvox reticuliferus]